MSSLDDAALGRQGRARIERALLADPALEAELELIAAELAPGAASVFWAAFAEECERHARPAGAVLAALERAARNAAG